MINPARRQFWFDLAADNPGAWLSLAEMYKAVADKIDAMPDDFGRIKGGIKGDILECH